jgi:hypothetical protein
MDRETHSLLAPNLFMNSSGKMFEKKAGVFARVWNKYVEAEERYVKNQLEKKGVSSYAQKYY